MSTPQIPVIGTTAALTPLQIAAQALIQARNRTAQQMTSVRAAVNNFIWKDPTKAQAAFNALTAVGAKAADLLADEKAYQAFVLARTGTAPGPVMPAGYTLTLNADGSIIVVAPTTGT